MIRFSQVYKRYEGDGARADALRGVSLALEAGEMAFLTGRSGAGKSTLLRLIAAIERPTRGEVVVNGHSVGRLRSNTLAHYRQRIGFVFQDHKLLPDRTVFDNVALPLRVAGAGAPETGRRVRAALDRVGLLGKERALPRMLSGGEQQRVGIARAVVARPAVLLADEPTGNLDPALSREVIRLLRDFAQVGVCVLIASHDVALIRTLDARVLTLDRGELVADGALTDAPPPTQVSTQTPTHTPGAS